uniref:Protein CUSTOS n=1 Tax=Leptobrachium leishanense TaxID=445787 RepID=A0A8C5LZB0_9ANUR
MAAPKCTPRDSDSSDEDLERFREAAWEPAGSKPIQIHEETNPPAAPSLRVQADCHEHDGNELQTTPEFRSHIAKKLSAILDSSIKVVTGSGIHQTENETTSDTQDSGFRLFYTSIPGDTGQVKDTAIPRCKVASSSDDSEEEEQRCREAAVSGADIIMNGALKTTSMESTNKHCDSPQKKKKRKKKKKEGWRRVCGWKRVARCWNPDSGAEIPESLPEHWNVGGKSGEIITSASYYTRSSCV